MNAVAKARRLQAARLAKRREVEAACAFDFLVNGEEGHAERCVFVQACSHEGDCRREGCQPCSRTYDPLPYPEAAPTPSAMYVGTGVGALYGLPGTERHAWQLAGWNVETQGVIA